MTKTKKKRKIIFAALLIVVSAFSWCWYHFMTVHEPYRNKAYYHSELDTIFSIRKKLLKEKADLKKMKQVFIKNITEKIFPYWYGTPWDFNGTTESPQEGKIACGYFVTTTLKHMGVPINRVKMAQCASEEMIRSLTSKKYIYHLPGLSLTQFEQKLQALGNGLYIIGLDSHTGYVLISGNGNFFIHASGWFPYKVVRTPLLKADVIGRSKYRVLGRISEDEAFLKKWVAAN